MKLSVLVHLALGLALASAASASPEPAPEAFLVRRLQLDVRIDYEQESLSGFGIYEIENWTGRPANRVSFLLNRLMAASAVRGAAGQPMRYTQDVLRFRDTPMRQVTQVIVELPKPVPPGSRTTVRLDYGGNLAPYAEIGWLYVRDHIDTSFTILRSEALAFPVIQGLSDMANRKGPRDHFQYDVTVRVPPRYMVATGGKLARSPLADGTVAWRYESELPSPFLNICVAPFDTLSRGSVHVFYFPADSAGARRLLAGALAGLETYERWFGALHTQPELCITEIPDGWGSQADAVGGIIQTAAAFRDPERLRELYHELSHLWNAPDTEVAPPRWNEGLASFLEDLMQERLDHWPGRAASDSTLIAALKRRVARDSTLRSVAFIDYGKHDMTGRAYSVGDIMFSTLYELVGEGQFNRIVGGYYQAFPRGGTTKDFVNFAKRSASSGVSDLFDDWMFTPRWSEVLASATSVHDLAVHYRGK